MVVITDDYIREHVCKEESKTHLILSEKGITRVEVLRDFCTFKVIDLRHNQLTRTNNLENQRSLTHLFLQGNDLLRMDGFDGMVSLEVLYLDFNRIEVVENLDNCPLRKLSLRGQRLPPGQALAFDPTSMENMYTKLEDLNVSKNNLTSLKRFMRLKHLECLDISENVFLSLTKLLDCLVELRSLRELIVSKNPLCGQPYHKKEIIGACKKLERLDGKDVPDRTKAFCRQMVTNGRDNSEKHRRRNSLAYDHNRLQPGLRPKPPKHLLKLKNRKRLEEMAKNDLHQ